MVEFASHPGYAHVLEDERTFPQNFAEVRLQSFLSKMNIFLFLTHMQINILQIFIFLF